MKDLNAEMRMDFDEEIRFGMGIHAGETIVGMMAMAGQSPRQQLAIT